ncbi:MAG TPA: hypothetical protein DCO77_03375 [Nitrospiraceae bacterium]|nr:hypothetical protein [Nitrospiraceae bacterium]
MKKIVVVAVGVLFCLAGVSTPALAEDQSINFGGMGLVAPDLSASVFYAEYERMLNDNHSLFFRLGSLDYDYDDGEYKEDGDGPGVDFGIRRYFSGDGMKGFFIGGTVGIWTTDWTFSEPTAPLVDQAGEGSSTAAKIDFEVGGRIPMGSGNVWFIPSFHIGTFVSLDDECNSTSLPGASCTVESEVGFYGLLGLALGVAF